MLQCETRGGKESLEGTRLESLEGGVGPARRGLREEGGAGRRRERREEVLGEETEAQGRSRRLRLSRALFLSPHLLQASWASGDREAAEVLGAASAAAARWRELAPRAHARPSPGASRARARAC